MKNKKANLFILFIAAILVLYFSLKDDFLGVVKIFSNINIFMFLLAIILFLISLIFKALSLTIFLKEYYPDYNLKKAYKLTLISQFLNGITPFQSGGQPFEIYLLKKEGKRITDSTNALLKEQLSFQIALILTAVFCIILNIIFKVYDNGGLNFFVIIGLLVNVIVLLILVLIMSTKKIGFKIVNKITDFIYKFKFSVKFPSREKVNESLKHFYATGLELKKNKISLILSVLSNIINLFILYIIPLIAFMSCNNYDISLLDSIIGTSFVMLIGNFIPVPGATGGVEYAFYIFFGNFTKGAVLTCAMLIWRFITYAFAVLLGFITLILRKEGKK